MSNKQDFERHMERELIKLSEKVGSNGFRISWSYSEASATNFINEIAGIYDYTPTEDGMATYFKFLRVDGYYIRDVFHTGDEDGPTEESVLDITKDFLTRLS